MEDLSYRTLIWLNYRLAATFSLGVPLVLVAWAMIKREKAMVKLLSTYWQISSLFAISLLLLTDQKPLGYLTLLISPMLMVGSVWFWVDLNEELTDMPQWRPLAFTIRIWRWALSFVGIFATIIAFLSLSCFKNTSQPICMAWVEAPIGFHQISQKIFNFILGANWSEPLAAFFGYLFLMGYLTGLIHWILVQLPKRGRIAGGF